MGKVKGNALLRSKTDTEALGYAIVTAASGFLESGIFMFVLQYEWRVKPGREQDFVEAWSKLTKLIYERRGSLGSRLHRTDDGRLISYAQWPSREAWDVSNNMPTVPEEGRYRRVMRESAIREEPDTFMTVVEDKLAREPYRPNAGGSHGGN